VPHAPKYVYTPLSFDAWRRRLIENKITHVIALAPEPVELRWMSQAPEQFRLIVGGIGPSGEWWSRWHLPEKSRRVVGGIVANDSWGLFEFRRVPGQNPGAPQL
jgi:hypothetical protein